MRSQKEAAPVTYTRLLLSPQYPMRVEAPFVVHRVRSGARSVSAAGLVLGAARSVDDVVGLLGGIGMADHDPCASDDVVVEWRGGGPDAWLPLSDVAGP